jgi:transposase-like protein
MAQIKLNLDTDLLHELFSKEGRNKGMSKLMETILNQVLELQAEEQLGAKPYERSENRTAYRNGYRDRQLKTRIGSLTLSVPRFRSGEFSTSLFTRYQRSEQALVLSMMEMVINGVSTRNVTMVTEELCGTSFSKSTISLLCKRLDPVVEEFRNRPLNKHYPFVIVDALYTKSREEKRVRSIGVLIAKAVAEDGKREIIGFTVADSESESSWSTFFTSLKERGLKNVDYLISDNHTGLRKALAKQFQGSTWQRCQTHFSRNILDAANKKSQPELKSWLKSMYNAQNITIAREIKDEIISVFEAKAPKAIEVLESGFDDAMAVMDLPEKYRRRLRTSNSIERLNQEIRRRERVIRIFPNRESVIRLVGALLIEQHEKWSSGKRYFDMEEYYDSIEEAKIEKSRAS